MLRFHQRARRRRRRWRRSRCRRRRRSRFGVVAGRRAGSRDRLPREAASRPRCRAAGHGARVDGHLHLRHATCWCRRSKRTRAQPTSHDFGKDIIPALIAKVPVYAYRFYDENKKAAKYWRDIGTLDAYYEANMDLCHVNPEFNLYDPEWPLRTYQPQAPPAKFVFADDGRRCGQALDSIISPGCIISGSRITRQRAVPERPRAQLLRHRAEHPDAGRARRPARAHPARDHRSRRVHPARRAASATTPKKIAAATPSPTAASSSSRPTTSRSSARSARRRCGTRRSSIARQRSGRIGA